MKGHSPEREPLSSRAGSTTRRAGASLVLVALGYLVWCYPLAVVTVTAVVGAILGMLFMHELGHYAAARAVGMKVTDFYLGFGPRLWGFQRSETSYGLRALPLGAYVRIIGMSRDDVVAPGDEHRAFRVKSYPRRVLVLCAGSFMHLVLAFIAFLIMHAALGAPVDDSEQWRISEVLVGSDGVVSPARTAGLEVGDRVVAVAGADTEDLDAFLSQVRSRPGEHVSLTVERDGNLLSLEATVATDPATGSGRLGVDIQSVIAYETVGVPTAALRALRDVGRAIPRSAAALWSLFANVDELVDRVFSPPGDPTANENLRTRPLGIYGFGHILSHSSVEWSNRVMFFGLANIFIGAFNLLPLPPLDGGHLAVATYERWRERGGRGRYLSDPRKLAPVTTFVATFLLLLAIGLLYLDIANPIDL